MARPIKNYCDYFPHDRDMRNHKKVKALRTKFKLDGYAVWSMLLEYLTGSDGNEFEFSELELELISGDFGVSVTEITDIINYCVKLELLFIKNGFIHSESLDENLLPVYEKRQVAKELSKRQQRNNGKYVSNNTDSPVVSVTEMPQSKVDKSRVDKIKVNNKSSSFEKYTDSNLLPYKSSEFLECWAQILQTPKWAKKSDAAIDKTIELMKKYNEPFVINQINTAIAGQWQGLFFTNTDNEFQKFTGNGNSKIHTAGNKLGTSEARINALSKW